MNSLLPVAGPFVVAALVAMVIGAGRAAWVVTASAAVAAATATVLVDAGPFALGLCLVAAFTVASMAAGVPDAIRSHLFGDRTAGVVAAVVPAWFAVAAAIIVEPEASGWLVALVWAPIAVLVVAGRGPGSRVAAAGTAAASLIGVGLIGIGSVPSDGGGVLAAGLGIVLATSPVTVLPVLGRVVRVAAPAVVAVPFLTASAMLSELALGVGEFGGGEVIVIVLAVAAVWALIAAPCLTVAPGGWAALALAVAMVPSVGGDPASTMSVLRFAAPFALVVAVLAWAVTRIEALIGSTRIDTVPALRCRAPGLAAVALAASALSFVWITWLVWATGAVSVIVLVVGAWALSRTIWTVMVGGDRPLIAGPSHSESVVWPWAGLVAAVAAAVML